MADLRGADMTQTIIWCMQKVRGYCPQVRNTKGEYGKIQFE